MIIHSGDSIMKVSVVLQKSREDGLKLSDEVCSRLDDYFSRANSWGLYQDGVPRTPTGIPLIFDRTASSLQPTRDVEHEGTTFPGIYGCNYEKLPRNHPYLIRVVNELDLASDDTYSLCKVDVPDGELSFWLVSGEDGERAYGHEPLREERDIEFDRSTVQSPLVDPAKIMPIPKTPGEEARAMERAKKTLDRLATSYSKDQAIDVSMILQKAVIFKEEDRETGLSSYFIASPSARYVSQIPFEEKPEAFRNETAAHQVIKDFLSLSGYENIGIIAKQQERDANKDVQEYIQAREAAAIEALLGSPELLVAREISQRFRVGVRPSAGSEITADTLEDGRKLRP